MAKPPADPTLKMISVRLSESTLANLDAIALANGLTRTGAIGHAASIAVDTNVIDLGPLDATQAAPSAPIDLADLARLDGLAAARGLDRGGLLDRLASPGTELAVRGEPAPRPVKPGVTVGGMRTQLRPNHITVPDPVMTGSKMHPSLAGKNAVDRRVKGLEG